MFRHVFFNGAQEESVVFINRHKCHVYCEPPAERLELCFLCCVCSLGVVLAFLHLSGKSLKVEWMQKAPLLGVEVEEPCLPQNEKSSARYNSLLVLLKVIGS